MSATQKAILQWAAREILPDCADEDIPTPADLRSWMPQAPSDVLDAAVDDLTTLYGHDGGNGFVTHRHREGPTLSSRPCSEP